MRRGLAAAAAGALVAVSPTSASTAVAAAARPRTAVLIAGDADASVEAWRRRIADLARTRVDVVDDAVVEERLRGPAGRPVAVDGVQTIVREAEQAFAALEPDRSVALLESAIEQLEADRDFSVEKQALLEQVRLTCAQRLVGLAGPKETGRAETKNGARAQHHLAGVLRLNPTFTLDAQRYPPKLRSLLGLASDDVKRSGLGGLHVTSTPAGATVRLDGRALGLTPLTIHGALAPGRYRLWLEQERQRSFARVVDVTRGVDVPVEVDVGFEGALEAARLAVHPSASTPTQTDAPMGVPAPTSTPTTGFTAARWRKLAGLLDVDALDVVGVVGTDAVIVRVDGASGRAVAGALLPRAALAQPAASIPDAVRRVVVDVDSDAAAGVAPPGFIAPAAWFAPETTSTSSPASGATTSSGATGDDDSVWPVLALAGGVVGAVVLAGAVTAGVLSVTRTTEKTFAVQLVERP